MISKAELADLPRWPFGDSAEMADRLAALIVAGVKTGTCSAKASGDWGQAGDRGVLVNGANKDVAVLEIDQAHHLRFDEVTEDLAVLEGEGDLSFQYWKTAHIAFFQREGTYSPDMNVVFEQFHVVEVLDEDFAKTCDEHVQLERALIVSSDMPSNLSQMSA